MLAEKLGMSIDEIPFMYPDEKFSTKLTKDLATQALNLKMDKFHSSRLEQLCNIKFNRDNRTEVEYAIDLIYGWFVEDLISEYLQGKGFKVQLSGVDREREFLSSGQIKSDLDLHVSRGGKTRYFDVYFDSQNYWEKNNKMDVRESKWNTIMKENASIICVSNAGFAIIDGDSEHTFAPNPLWGGKKCATIKGIKSQLVDIDTFIGLLKSKIKE